MDWHRGRSGSYRYIRVHRDAEGFHEIGAIDDVKSFTLNRSKLTELKVDGTLDYIVDPDIGNDMVRIYYDAEQDGETVSVPLATMFLDAVDLTIWYGTEQGSGQLYSILRIPAKKTVPAGTDGIYHIPAGTNAIAYAVGLLEELGLPVRADASTATLNSEAKFDPANGETYLTVINYLTTFAGFSSCYPDGMGTCILEVYRSPSEQSPVVTFSDSQPEPEHKEIVGYGEATIYGASDVPFNPSITYSYDTFDVPNVVTIVCSGADADSPTLISTARNDDPDSPFSTVSRGYEISLYESVNDIASQSALDTYAVNKLEAQSSNVESVEVTHPYTDEFGIGDMAIIDYSLAGKSWQMNAVSMSMSSTHLLDCKTKFRRYVVG